MADKELEFTPDETDVDVFFSPEETMDEEVTFTPEESVMPPPVDVEFTPEETDADFFFPPNEFDDVMGADQWPPPEWQMPAGLQAPERDPDMVREGAVPPWAAMSDQEPEQV